jgi:hypothetical protein
MVNFMAKFEMKLRGSAVAQIFVIPALYQRQHDWGLHGRGWRQRGATCCGNLSAGWGSARMYVCVYLWGVGGGDRARSRENTRARAHSLIHTYTKHSLINTYTSEYTQVVCNFLNRKQVSSPSINAELSARHAAQRSVAPLPPQVCPLILQSYDCLLEHFRVPSSLCIY